jgi:DNA repair protein RadC
MEAKDMELAYGFAPKDLRVSRKAVQRSIEDQIIAKALDILARRLQARDAFTSPEEVKRYVRLNIAREDREVFCVLYLDAQNRLIECVEEFRGTLTQTSVYPREVVKGALARGAAAVILAHNHPSGTTQPSRADEALTQTLKTALALVDCRVLDHIIATRHEALSMAEKGLL